MQLAEEYTRRHQHYAYNTTTQAQVIDTLKVIETSLENLLVQKINNYVSKLDSVAGPTISLGHPYSCVFRINTAHMYFHPCLVLLLHYYINIYEITK